MSVPVTTINIHHVARIAARSQQSLGAPVTIRCCGTGDHGDTEVTIYFGDQELADRLVTAINHAMRPMPSKPVPSDEADAYVAAHYQYKGSAR
jgi:hypothetical protein